MSTIHVALLKSFFFSFFLYVCISVRVYTHDCSCPKDPEEGDISSRVGAEGCFNPLMWMWKNSLRASGRMILTLNHWGIFLVLRSTPLRSVYSRFPLFTKQQLKTQFIISQTPVAFEPSSYELSKKVVKSNTLCQLTQGLVWWNYILTLSPWHLLSNSKETHYNFCCKSIIKYSSHEQYFSVEAPMEKMPLIIFFHSVLIFSQRELYYYP